MSNRVRASAAALLLVAATLLPAAPPCRAQQVSIPRIEAMPALPAPYAMRDWKAAAVAYDAFVFDWSATGTYLPLIFEGSSLNYPSLGAFGLQTYVGMDLGAGEAINVLPAVIGASLVGLDKRGGERDYVLQCQQWYNRAGGADLYLNNPDAVTGGDWWYETMPNLFFYQLQDLYPGAGEFDSQMVRIADRWLEMIEALGGSAAPWSLPDFDHTAFSFQTMEPVDRGWQQPEAAGAVAWMLAAAWRSTGDERYRIGAELCMDYLNQWPANPSYEIQLPWGVQAAARLNAELHTAYDLEKMINWVFEMSAERNWGVVVGNWGGYDVSGLVGEVDADGYAFQMNGYQTAAALVPVVRYDDRFARALGRWVLNLANASRLYFTPFLPDSLQDGEWWTQRYDPAGVIGHEAIRQDFWAENRQNAIYATGDATYGGWAATNFALYGSSHMGYLAAIVDTTDVPGVLQLDARATDFHGREGYPTSLVYNPHDTQQSVTVALGPGTVDLWDAAANQWAAAGVSGSAVVDIPADAARLLVEVPSSAVVASVNGVLRADGVAVDYADGSPVGNRAPRVRALAAQSDQLLRSGATTLHARVMDPDGDTPTFDWSTDVGTVSGSGTSVTFTAPDSADTATVRLIVTDPGSLADTADVRIVIVPSQPPVAQSITLDPPNPLPGESVVATCTASDPESEPLSYAWSVAEGSIAGSGASVTWTAPATAGVYRIACRVTDSYGLADSAAVWAIVGDLVLHLPLDGSGSDAGPFTNHATVIGGEWVADRHDTPSSALRLAGSSSRVEVPSSLSLNGEHALTLAFWMAPDRIPSQDEWYIVSHGSWENRWKITLSSTARLRWTVNSSEGIHDLDSQTDLAAVPVFVAATFGEGQMKLYLNGELDASTAHGGTMAATAIDMLVGQKLPGEPTWNFEGVIDEVRLYNRVLSQAEIAALVDMDMAVPGESHATLPDRFAIVRLWPNPFNDRVQVQGVAPRMGVVTLDLFNVLGQRVRRMQLIPGQAGRWSATMQLRHLASGRYVIRASLEGSPDVTRWITLLR